MGADLRGADLRGADLSQADLSRADLSEADLTFAKLRRADLRWAKLRRADLPATKLGYADLSGADLREADLSGADLREADLRGADLRGADLSRADLSEADLRGAGLREADLFDALGLRGVRKSLRETGWDEQARRVNCWINRTDISRRGKSEQLFSYVFFDLTAEYGAAPGRPLRVLLVLILAFGILYMIAVDPPPWSTKAGVWRSWPKDRVHQDIGGPAVQRVIASSLPWMVFWASYFSLLSAFHIGWRDLNVGNWLVRINPNEYNVRATGWVKVVSGIQSILSVYLVALSVLSYFGHPFG